MGLSSEDLQGWKWTAVIHPEDVEGIVNKWRASIASGEPFLHEARVRRADGEYRWMLHHIIAERDEHGKIVKWYGSSIDIDDRKQAEERIRQSEMELRQILDFAPQHVCCTWDPMEVVFISTRRRSIITVLLLKSGRAATFASSFIPMIGNVRIAKFKMHSQAGPRSRLEARVRRHDGKYRWFLFRYKPLRDEQGRITRWYVAGDRYR